jgi:hypothetical protein
MSGHCARHSHDRDRLQSRGEDYPQIGTPLALVRHAGLTRPCRGRCDRTYLLLEITYATGDVGRSDFPTVEAMLEWVERRKLIFRDARFPGRAA